MNWREFKEAIEDQARALGIDADTYDVSQELHGRRYELTPDVDIHAQTIWADV